MKTYKTRFLHKRGVAPYTDKEWSTKITAGEALFCGAILGGILVYFAMMILGGLYWVN